MTKKYRISIVGGIITLVLVFSPGAWCQGNAAGSVAGTIFEGDGTTPVQGAVVLLENINSGEIYKSTPTDKNGSFLIDQIKTGVYLYGINSAFGSFFSDGLVGIMIKDGEPARMSLALNSVNKKKEIEARMASERPGENLIGEVVAYNPENRLTEVQIIRGVLKEKDRIHVVGTETDFYQNVDYLHYNGTKTTRLFVNQKGLLEAKKAAQPGDLVYLAEDKAGFWAFLSGPAGMATLIASTAAIGYVAGDVVTDGDTKEASPFK
jgi:hypothetical protein